MRTNRAPPPGTARLTPAHSSRPDGSFTTPDSKRCTDGEGGIQVLSVRQPDADDIIYGTKWNELRVWNTSYGGPLYIHASRWDVGEWKSVGPGRVGAIISLVELVDCIPEEDLLLVHAHLWRRRRLLPRLVRLAEFLKGFPQDSWEHGIGEWNWILEEPQPSATPIPT